jgi:NAD(P)-dependent dehydrogenase (short-subunit alcohol dehydrogenase family)
MMKSLQGRRVVVSGGASGIGRATVSRLADEGAAVAVIDVDDEAGRSLRRDGDPEAVRGRISYHHADVSSEPETVAAIAEAVTTLGGLDVLITAAGIMRGQLQEIGDLDEATWDQVLDVNLKGAFIVSKHAAQVMLPSGRGVIILVGSKAGMSVGSGSFAYGASKGGVHGLALALERHLGPRGIRVNDLAPSDVDTPLYRRSVQEGVEHGGDQAVADEMLEEATSAERIADVLAFLASDAASAVRGTVFTA